MNGAVRRLRCDPSEPLVDVLRRELRLFGVREACGVGICGSCTVLLDGSAVSSCLLPTFMVEGAELVTVEGLGSAEAPGPVQQAYIDDQAYQCAFCTPGFVVSTQAAIEELEATGEDTLDAHIESCLCRCGSYEFIRRAARAVAGREGTGS